MKRVIELAIQFVQGTNEAQHQRKLINQTDVEKLINLVIRFRFFCHLLISEPSIFSFCKNIPISYLCFFFWFFYKCCKITRTVFFCTYLLKLLTNDSGV